MTPTRPTLRLSATRALVLLLTALFQTCLAQNPTYCTIPGTTTQGLQGDATDPYTGKPTCLAINRQPALYTGDFGDCLGSSEMEVTRFSAAYYKDNMTLSFDLEGRTELNNVNTIVYISVYAYGENHFQYIWNPCGSSAQTLCPTNNTRPFTSTLLIPLGPSDVDGIPDIAFHIPDFEGQAVMRIFSNNTQQEIACYSAVVSNGITFAQPAAIGTIVGLFVLVALGTSVATAICGANLIENRLHYAHSMSVWVVFAVLQHVFMTGALSVNWPSVLPAWWKNFAWAAGMIYSPTMQNSIDTFVGNDLGNTTFVGAASIGASSDNTGGGYTKGQILQAANSQGTQRRAISGMFRKPAMMEHALRAVEQHQNRHNLTFAKRDNVNDTFTWFGAPVTPGLPLPGNYSGFAGTLSLENIPASNAFMTAFLWLIVIIVILAATTVALKWSLEGLVTLKWIQADRFPLFRKHWLRFTGQVALRTCFIAFFLMMFLTMFQFSYHGAAGSIGIAAIIFLLFLLGAIGLASWACWYRLRHGRFIHGPDRLHLKVCNTFPPFAFTVESKRAKETGWAKSLFSVPWIKVEYNDDDPQRADVHHDEDYIKKFGWLTARFRVNEWWFFVFWLSYDFLRAIFLGGAAGHPQTQVFALLAIEFTAFCVLIWAKPFEANRSNALMVYLLGLSKILTTALSSAFDPSFNLGRIVTAALGIIIIVIQALLLLAMLILIVIGCVSTYISLMRNRKVFYPVHWRPAQRAYLRHLNGDEKSRGAVELVEGPGVLGNAPKESKRGFRVDSIRRMPKIGDADVEAQHEDPFGSSLALSGHASPIGSLPPPPGTHTRRTSRAFSTTSGHGSLPFGARPARSESWSTHDYHLWNGVADGNRDSMPRLHSAAVSAFHSKESLHMPSEREGYSVAPSRGRASTLRGVAAPPGGSRVATPSVLRKGSATPEENQLEVPKIRRRDHKNDPLDSEAVKPPKADGSGGSTPGERSSSRPGTTTSGKNQESLVRPGKDPTIDSDTSFKSTGSLVQPSRSTSPTPAMSDALDA